MRKIVLQLFVNKHKLVREIETLQTPPSEGWNRDLIDSKHSELDRYNHLINLFFESVGI